MLIFSYLFVILHGNQIKTMISFIIIVIIIMILKDCKVYQTVKNDALLSVEIDKVLLKDLHCSPSDKLFHFGA